ncbi:hypothetical protein HNY73_014235 [Argiope bruennichi]|uniref:Uncharacterized protein n=1 Tax=Argiope bruennichi TaxID=94029 RepID=A0A8T0ESF3_ARGBR|nr:hypothetical protein HNY73_014235 [Argiope bruennichi]
MVTKVISPIREFRLTQERSIKSVSSKIHSLFMEDFVQPKIFLKYLLISHQLWNLSLLDDWKNLFFSCKWNGYSWKKSFCILLRVEWRIISAF